MTSNKLIFTIISSGVAILALLIGLVVVYFIIDKPKEKKEDPLVILEAQIYAVQNSLRLYFNEKYDSLSSSLDSTNKQLVMLTKELNNLKKVKKSKSRKKTATVNAVSKKPNYEVIIHEIKKGEGLSTVADAYGVSMASIKESNADQIRNDTILIYPGKLLIKKPLPPKP